MYTLDTNYTEGRGVYCITLIKVLKQTKIKSNCIKEFFIFQIVLGLTQYVTVMAGLAIDGIPFGGIIHKPFENKTIWGFGDRKNELLGHIMLMDSIR